MFLDGERPEAAGVETVHGSSNNQFVAHAGLLKMLEAGP